MKGRMHRTMGQVHTALPAKLRLCGSTAVHHQIRGSNAQQMLRMMSMLMCMLMLMLMFNVYPCAATDQGPHCSAHDAGRCVISDRHGTRHHQGKLQRHIALLCIGKGFSYSRVVQPISIYGFLC